MVVFNDKMWMLGGKGAGNAHLGDILTSTDGANWIPQTTENPFPARYWHQALVFNNKLWIFNGQSVNDRPPKRSRDIYSSVDGINWVLETNSPAYGGIIGHQILPFDGKLWLVSGYTNGYRQDVYSSDDAINWTLENNNAFEKTAYHQVVNFKRQLFMYKGSGNGYEGHLVSKNGRDWKPFNEKLFAKRQMHQVVEFNASLWMIGGRNYENEFTPGVFTSIYGQVWTQVLSGNDAPFSARDQHQLVVFNNALWVIGGRDIDGFKNDVWKSTDGKAWNKVDQVTSFSARGGHQSFVFNNKLWVVGGTSPEGYLNDVWSSGDGANWQQESSNAAFSPRYDHRVTSLNGELYLVAGFGLDDVNPVVFDDVYHSKDGIEWTHITKDADLARYGHELTTYNGQLVVTGGYVEGNASADILTSSDGIDWIKHTDALFHAGVSQHQTVFYRLQLLIIGGETNRLGFDYPDNQTYIASGFLNWYHLKPISFSFANTFEKIKLVTAAIKPQSDLLKTGYEVLLDGSESDATDYQNMAFAWTLVEKPEGSLAAIDDAFRISTHFTPDLDGTYTVELVVTDGGHSDSTRITFNTLTEPTAVITGCDANVYEGDTVTMDGSASFDKYGNPLTYFWTLSAPRGADNSLDDPTASSVTKVLNREGRYNFFLTVDNGGMAHSTSKSCQVDYFPI
ncbi:MAG: PKD domain-containing protein [Cellvibrionales bacterium]|nr:PKD domain-containing protein [Cellvibrionales bacterium]